MPKMASSTDQRPVLSIQKKSLGKFLLLNQGEAAEIQSDAFTLPPEGIVLDQLNQNLIQQALDLVGGNQVRAAKLLGLTRGTLRYRLDKYGIKAD